MDQPRPAVVPVGLRPMTLSQEAADELRRILDDPTIPGQIGKPCRLMTDEEVRDFIEKNRPKSVTSHLPVVDGQ
jgi:hypothetical protein